MEVVMGKFYCSKSAVVGLRSLAKSLAPSFLAKDQRHTANRPAFSMTYLQAIEYFKISTQDGRAMSFVFIVQFASC
jgi:hypothetical protein